MGGGWWLAIGVPTRVVDVLADVTSTPTPRCTRRYLQPRWGGVLVLRDSVVLALTLGGARAQTVLLHYHSLNLLHLFLDLHAHATKASPARRVAIPSGVDRRALRLSCYACSGDAFCTATISWTSRSKSATGCTHTW